MEFFKAVTLWIALGAEAMAVIIIALALIVAVIRLVPSIGLQANRGPATHRDREDVRLSLGRWLVLALEFLLAAKIMRTAVAPSWREIGQPAAIAVLWTALNDVLQQEMDRVEAQERSAGGAP